MRSLGSSLALAAALLPLLSGLGHGGEPGSETGVAVVDTSTIARRIEDVQRGGPAGDRALAQLQSADPAASFAKVFAALLDPGYEARARLLALFRNRKELRLLLRRELSSARAERRCAAAWAYAQIGPLDGEDLSALLTALEDSEETVRARCVLALGRDATRADRRIAALLKQGEPRQREACLQYANHRGARAAALLPSLRALFAEDDPLLRIQAAHAFWRCGGDPAVVLSELRRGLRSPPGPYQRAALMQLSLMGGHAPELLSELKALIPQADAPTWVALEPVLRLLGPRSEDVAAEVLAAYQARSAPAVKRRIAGVLGALPVSDRSLKFLRAALNDPDPIIRGNLCFGLAASRRGAAKALADELVARAKIEPDRRVQANILAALRETASSKPAVLALWQSLVAGSDAEHRQVAGEALIKLGGAALTGLELLSRTSEPLRARESAALILGHIKDRRGLELLQRLLRDGAESVRAKALHSLVRLRELGRVARASLEALVRDPAPLVRYKLCELFEAYGAAEYRAPLSALTQKDGDARVRERARAALAAVRAAPGLPSASIPELIAGLKSAESFDRLEATRDLWRYGSAAVPALIELLSSRRSQDRLTAASVLGLLGLAAEDAVPALGHLLKDREPAVRSMAKRALRAILRAEDREDS